MRTNIIVYRLFDVADEVNLDPVCAWIVFPQNPSPSMTPLF